MKLYKELMYIIGFAYLGQIISRVLNIPVPGSVIGLIIFFIFLKTEIIHLSKVETSSKFLVENLAVLFIPAGVGIITQINQIKNIWIIIFVVCFITTVFSLAFVGIIMQYLIKRGEKDDRDNN